MNIDNPSLRAKNIRLRIYQPDAAPRCIGDSGPLVELHLRKTGILPAILKHPGIRLGTSYVHGDWDTDTLQLPRLLQALLPAQNTPHDRLSRLGLTRLRTLVQLDIPPRWRDDDSDIARACLGAERLHSCGWFREPDISLEEAQRIQRRALLGQLQLRPGQHLLNIDGGWGMLAVWLAEQAGVQVTAMVATRKQLQFAQQLARRHDMHLQVRFQLGDIRSCTGQFDRILGTSPCAQRQGTALTLLKPVQQLLRSDGFAWLQLIIRRHPGELNNGWLQRQMNPPRPPLLSELAATVEASQLRALHLEDRSTHWLSTLENWALRYQRRRDLINRKFGAVPTRHWEFMLASQAAAMRDSQLGCYDILLGNVHCNWPSQHEPERLPGSRLALELNRALASLTRHR
ncbi:MAG: class I SAM-dependent methyltransferase [Thiogranum sp.]|nr:class I SAM-dependent methyltransferase [Thiogranum sp.]